MKYLNCGGKKGIFALNVLLTILIIVMIATCFVGLSYRTDNGLSLAVSTEESIKDKSELLKTQEIWDNDSKSFNPDVMSEWMEVLFGDEEPLEYIKTNAVTKYNSLVVQSTTLKTKAKDENQGLILTLDGKQWMITSLTTTPNKENPDEDDVVATLYLKNPSTSNRFYSSNSDTKGNNVYARSEIRNNVVLNKTGAFALFNETGEDGFAEQFLVQPKNINYQKSGQTVKEVVGWGYHCPNDVLVPPTSGWHNNMSYTAGENFGGYRYDAWGDDYIWLPSVSEPGYNGQGSIWGLTDAQRSFTGASYSWLRSGNDSATSRGDAYVLAASGGYTYNYVTTAYGVRPALHLNLTSAVLGTARGVAPTPESGYDYIYREDKADQSSNNGDSSTRKTYNDVKLRHMSKKEAENNFERFVLGNIEPNTNIETFLNNLRSKREFIKIYAGDNQSTPLYDGLAGDPSANENALKQLVKTGYKVELWGPDKKNYPDNPDGPYRLDTVYLSILGDVTGDGYVNAMDVTALRQMLQAGNIKTYPMEVQLAAYLNNKGQVNEIDIELLQNIATGKISQREVFENTTSITTDYQFVKVDIDTANGRVMRRDLTADEIDINQINSDTNNIVIGNIAQKTSVKTFVTKLKAMPGMASATFKLYKADGTQVTDLEQDEKFKNPIESGWYITLGSKTDKIYLSVLGDVTGDGFVNAMDVTYLNRLANDRFLVAKLLADKSNLAYVVSALITNKGMVTSADSALLWQAICDNADLNQYA